MPELTKEQLAARDTKGNVIVSAGAGAGKTFVLTQRVLHFIRDEKYTLDQFLILTFTNLAAGEMKKRIRDALMEESKKPELDDETRKRMADASSSVDFADICTFDSYALSLVKKYHFDLGISANVSNVDSSLVSVRKRTIIADIFEEMYQKYGNDENSDFSRMIRSYCFKDDDVIQDLLYQFYERANLAEDTEEYLNDFEENHFSDEFIQGVYEKYLNEVIRRVTALGDDRYLVPGDKETKGKKYRDIVADGLQPLFDALKKEGDVLTYLNSAEQLTFPRANGFSAEEKENYNGFRKECTECFSYIHSLPKSKEEFIGYFENIRPYVRLMVSMAKELDQRIMAYKRLHDAYEFGDIAKFAFSLVRDHADIRDSIKNHLKMIMIDEYQDTSSIQESFVSMIADDNVYMVGDIKQSIYRFRNARCDIFRDKYSSFKSGKAGSTAIDMNSNFRSSKEVLDDVNFIFKQIMTKDYGGADYHDEQMADFGNQDYIKCGDYGKKNNLSFLVRPNLSGNDIADCEARLIAADILKKMNDGYQIMDKDSKTMRPVRFSDFCIIMDRGREFDEYTKILSECHVPLFVENNKDISKNNLVLVMTNLIRIISCIEKGDYQSKDFIKAFLSLSRSFLFSYTDERIYQIFKENSFKEDELIVSIREILQENHSCSNAEKFRKVIFGLSIYDHFVTIGDIRTNTVYLDYFLNQFESMSRLDYSFDDFISYMESIDELDLRLEIPSVGNEYDSVQIMNIHKSKGLEYGIVYFPGLHKSFNDSLAKKKFGVSDDYGMYFDTGNKLNLIKDMYLEKERKEELSEKIRLLYVALTRVREKIIIVCESEDANGLLAHLSEKNMDVFFSETEAGKDAQQKLDIAFDAMKRKEISKDTFALIAERLLSVRMDPKDILKLDSEKSASAIKARLDEKAKSVNRIKTLADLLRHKYLSDEQCVSDAYQRFISHEFDRFTYEAVMEALGYSLTDKFRKVLDSKGDNLTEKDFKSTWISHRQDIFQRSDDEKKYKYEKYLNNALSLLSVGIIQEEDIHDFLSLTGITLTEELNAVLPKLSREDKVSLHRCIAKGTADDGDSYRSYLTLVRDSSLNQEKCYHLLSYVDGFDMLMTSYRSLALSLEPSEVDEVLSLSGISLTDSASSVVHGENASEDAKAAFDSKPCMLLFTFEPSFYDMQIAEGSFCILHTITDLLRQGKTSLAETVMSVFGYEFTQPYRRYLADSIWHPYFEDIGNVIEEKGQAFAYEDPKEIKCLLDLIRPFMGYGKFDHYTYETDIDFLPYQGKKEEMAHVPLVIKDFSYQRENEMVSRASKSLKISSSREALEFGTRLHFIMEATDFLHPDYEALKGYGRYVRAFLESDLMKNVSAGVVYKEYEFYDPEQNMNGIIDLMVIYEDHIDIIDYKTKNISDEHYPDQLRAYQRYVSSVFKGKPIHLYLYSLMLSDCMKVD